MISAPLLTILLVAVACAACATAAAARSPDETPVAEPSARSRVIRPGAILVEATEFRSDKGRALIGLFHESKGFPDGKHSSRRVSVRIEKCGARAKFDGLAPGTYAVAILHDEDGDFEMSTNFLGIPTEGYGTSNNARRRFGPPEWDKARFELVSGATVVQKIQLIYH